MNVDLGIFFKLVLGSTSGIVFLKRRKNILTTVFWQLLGTPEKAFWYYFYTV